MAHMAESSSASTPFRGQEHGGSSIRSPALSHPLGKLSGLPLVECPDCGMARVLEFRVVQDTPNKGKTFFKCPRNGNPKLCGFYKFQKEYLDELLRLKVVVFKQLPIHDEEVGSDAGPLVQEEAHNGLEEKMGNLQCKMNWLLVLFCIFVLVMVVIWIVKA